MKCDRDVPVHDGPWRGLAIELADSACRRDARAIRAIEPLGLPLVVYAIAFFALVDVFHGCFQ